MPDVEDEEKAEFLAGHDFRLEIVEEANTRDSHGIQYFVAEEIRVRLCELPRGRVVEADAATKWR